MDSTAASLGQRWRFKPVSEDAINNYKDHEYPEWIEDCRKVLSNMHKALQRKEGQPAFRFEVANEGTRPGNDALVVIRAEGHFKICPPPFEKEDSEDGRQVEPSIPSPPTPPRGRWRASRTRLTPEGADSFVVPLGSNRPSASYTPIRESRRDPNGFYYKPTRITKPADTFIVECEQWRHGTDGEPFDGNIFLKKGMTTASGVLECEIHSENLAKPTKAGFKTAIGIRVEFLNGRGLFFDHRKEYIRWLSIPVKSPKPNGPKSSLCCLPHLVHPTGAVLAFLIAQYSRGFYGSYAVALAGGIYRADTLLPAPVGVGCKNGKKPKYGSALGGLF